MKHDSKTCGPLTIAAAICISVVACTGEGRTPRYQDPLVAEDSFLIFRSGDTLVPGLRRMLYLGRMDIPGEAPFFLVAGAECSECDAPPTVLLRSAAAGKAEIRRDLPGWYSYPGRIHGYPDTTVTLSDSRLFWGQCVQGTGYGLVQYLTEYTNGTPARSTVQETRVVGDSLVNTGPLENPTLIEMTLERVRSGRCKEVPPRNRPGDP
jgi:hypothetical protein